MTRDTLKQWQGTQTQWQGTQTQWQRTHSNSDKGHNQTQRQGTQTQWQGTQSNTATRDTNTMTRDTIKHIGQRDRKHPYPKGLCGAGTADINGNVAFLPSPEVPPLLVVNGTAGSVAKFTMRRLKYIHNLLWNSCSTLFTMRWLRHIVYDEMTATQNLRGQHLCPCIKWNV